MFKKILFVLLLSCLSFPALSQQSLKTENVILITLDGLRWQELYTGIDAALMEDEDYVENPDVLRELFWAENSELRRENLMPFFWNTIAEKGQLHGNMELGSRVDATNGLFFSYPGYSEILTGYVDEGVNSNDKIWNPNKTVLEFINEQPAFTGKVAAFGSWDVFPYIINSKRSGIPVNAGFEPVKGDDLSERELFLNELLSEIPSPWSTVRLDAFTHHYALEHLKKNKPALLYIAYGETDDFAHNGNYEAYIKSARQTDEFISELWDYAIRNADDSSNIVMTVGHNSMTEDTVFVLSAHTLTKAIKTATIACFGFKVDSWQSVQPAPNALKWIVGPKDLK